MVNTQNSNTCSVKFQDTVFKNQTELLEFYYQPKKSQDYVIMAKNNLSEFIDSSLYYIDVVKDVFPEILLSEIIDSANIDKRLFLGKISDDYGFSSLQFICKIKDSLLVKIMLIFSVPPVKF